MEYSNCCKAPILHINDKGNRMIVCSVCKNVCDIDDDYVTGIHAIKALAIGLADLTLGAMVFMLKVWAAILLLRVTLELLFR